MARPEKVPMKRVRKIWTDPIQEIDEGGWWRVVVKWAWKRPKEFM